MTSAEQDLDDFIGADVRDPEGEMLGQVRDLYVDGSGQPAWFRINIGFARENDCWVPAFGSSWREGDVFLPFGVDVVTDSPEIELDDELTPDALRPAQEYYAPHLDGAPGWSGTVTRHQADSHH
jgi:hypothetical protein